MMATHPSFIFILSLICSTVVTQRASKVEEFHFLMPEVRPTKVCSYTFLLLFLLLELLHHSFIHIFHLQKKVKSRICYRISSFLCVNSFIIYSNMVSVKKLSSLNLIYYLFISSKISVSVIKFIYK